MSKTGLYFGTFNPIHIGHLIIAEYMVEHTDLTDLWFVVTPSNPLKKKSALLDEQHRFYMANLAVEDDPRFRISDIEFKLPYPSYTANTLTYLQERYPQKEFVLIMGEDNLQTIEKWRNWEFILENFKLYVYPRPGYDGGKFKTHPHVRFVDAPQIEISATMIRESIRDNIETKYLLLPKVTKYIDEMNFYRK
ncbi:MAG: nicotinate-nucleotide adenylyltransferase [Bacteroidales bacterium]|jgi:nicotinate-nucleotide adenylyltransferase|nr:nicotinate-nucleotide adenylyltransferase [Bacteroidales bacterium]